MDPLGLGRLMPRTEREDLLSRIEVEEAKLASLDEQRSEIQDRLTELERQLELQGDSSPQVAATFPAQASLPTSMRHQHPL